MPTGATYTTTPDGLSLVWTGQVTITPSSDPFTNGSCTLTLTPAGGVSNLPALVAGAPGLPPVLRNVTVTQVPAGTTPAASTFSLVSPGGPGVAAVYDLALQVNSGATGTAGSNASVLGAADVSAPGTPLDGMTLIYSTSAAKLVLQAPPKPEMFAASSISATAPTNVSSAVVSTIGISPRPWAYRVRPSAQVTTGGTANTRVDLFCRVGNATSGDQMGHGTGVVGAPGPVTLIPGPGGPIAGGSLYGTVAANTSATVYLVAQQMASTTDMWSTASADACFTVETVPL